MPFFILFRPLAENEMGGEQRDVPMPCILFLVYDIIEIESLRRNNATKARWEVGDSLSIKC